MNGRALPLLALPVVGTGAGGAKARSGALMGRCWGAYADLAAAHEVDIALVTWDERAYAAAQAARRALVREGADPWRALAPRSRIEADRLGEQARDGRWCSSSAPASAWAPAAPPGRARSGGWRSARGWARGRSSAGDGCRRSTRRASRSRLGAEGLADEIVLAFADRRPALSHLLLGSQPVREAATTNHDQLFEEAYRNAHGGLAIIPDTPTVARGGWLLKMHGCVSDPSGIVLTRENYLRYCDRRAALAGIVQALLITRHMLFVGFSLRDDSFHRIAHDVRNAVGAGGERRTFGAALLLQEEPMQRDLWEDDLSLIAIASTPADSAARPDLGPARMLEVFLDRLGYEATTSAVTCSISATRAC